MGINVGIISTEVAPFGGVKESGIGREGSKVPVTWEEFLKREAPSCLGIHNQVTGAHATCSQVRMTDIRIDLMVGWSNS